MIYTYHRIHRRVRVHAAFGHVAAIFRRFSKKILRVREPADDGD